MSGAQIETTIKLMQEALSQHGRLLGRVLTPELAYGRHQGPAPVTARPSAVLVLLYPAENRWTTLLTLRTTHVATHANQVCFPGGAIEAEETPEEAALREWQEELGSCIPELRWLGRLPNLYVFHSNYIIVPCVAFATKRPHVHPNIGEVRRAFDLPLEVIGNPTCQGWHWEKRGAVRFRAPHIAWQGERIWGATAMLCEELYLRFQMVVPLH